MCFVMFLCTFRFCHWCFWYRSLCISLCYICTYSYYHEILKTSLIVGHLVASLVRNPTVQGISIVLLCSIFMGFEPSRRELYEGSANAISNISFMSYPFMALIRSELNDQPTAYFSDVRSILYKYTDMCEIPSDFATVSYQQCKTYPRPPWQLGPDVGPCWTVCPVECDYVCTILSALPAIYIGIAVRIIVVVFRSVSIRGFKEFICGWRRTEARKMSDQKEK